MPLSVGLRAGGPLQFSDVLAGAVGERFTPAVQIAAGSPIGALIELYAADPSAFTGSSVEFELLRTGADAVVARAAGRVSTTDSPGRRLVDATMTPQSPDPGAYTLSAIVKINGAPVGKVSRPLQITPRP